MTRADENGNWWVSGSDGERRVSNASECMDACSLLVMDIPTRLPPFAVLRCGRPNDVESYLGRPFSRAVEGVVVAQAPTPRTSVERRHPPVDPRLEDQDVPELVAQVPTSRPVEVPGLANREWIEHPWARSRRSSKRCSAQGASSPRNQDPMGKPNPIFGRSTRSAGT